jgi:hypothetical protein
MANWLLTLSSQEGNVTPSERIDVCIVSNRKIENELLERLYESVPVNKLIIDSETSPLGRAREKVISKVSTPRFMFLDDDVYLTQNYYAELTRHWRKNTGWLEGWAIPSRPEWFHEWMLSRFNRAHLKKICYNGRGFCCATIVETNALSDWRSPRDLEYYEDLSMSNHAIKKGYEVIRVPVACEHRIEYDIWAHVEKGVQNNMRARELSALKLIQYAGTTFLSGMKASLCMHNPTIASNSLKYAIKYLEPLHHVDRVEQRLTFPNSRKGDLYSKLKMVAVRTLLHEYDRN